MLKGKIYGKLNLCKNQKVLVQGPLVLQPGANVLIQDNTVVEVESLGTLPGGIFVMPGARIGVAGGPNKGVVFTSAKCTSERLPGDWFGIVLCGTSPVVNSADPGYIMLTEALAAIDAHIGQYIDQEGNVQSVPDFDVLSRVYGSSFTDGFRAGGGFGQVPNYYSYFMEYARIEYAMVGLIALGLEEADKLTSVQVTQCQYLGAVVFGGSVNLARLIPYECRNGVFASYGHTGQIVRSIIALNIDAGPFSNYELPAGAHWSRFAYSIQAGGYDPDTEFTNSNWATFTTLSTCTLVANALNKEQVERDYLIGIRVGYQITNHSVKANNVVTGFDVGIDSHGAPTSYSTLLAGNNASFGGSNISYLEELFGPEASFVNHNKAADPPTNTDLLNLRNVEISSALDVRPTLGNTTNLGTPVNGADLGSIGMLKERWINLNY